MVVLSDMDDLGVVRGLRFCNGTSAIILDGELETAVFDGGGECEIHPFNRDGFVGHREC